jgi:DNA-binding transcriptional MerR regulator
MDKSPDAFRTISEVAEDLGLPQHVLRFWETRFSHIRPLKRGGGRRYYRPDDVDLLKGIRHLLYGEGYTIKGVQRILKDEGVRFVQSVGRGELSVVASPLSAQAGESPADLRHSSGHEAGELQDGAVPDLPSMSSEDLQRLRGALDELVECDRVLTSLKTPGEA